MDREFDKFLNVPRQSLKTLTNTLNYVIKAKLWLQVLIAMVLGIATGLVLNPDFGLVSTKSASFLAEWIGLPGKLFLAIIQMIVVPLIFASIVQGIASASDINQLRSTGLLAFSFFLVTTALAVVVGIGVGSIVRPGSYIETEKVLKTTDVTLELEKLKEQSQGAQPNISLKTIPEKVTSFIPTNPMGAIVKGDMLQIVIFAIIFGIGLLLLEASSAKPLVDLFESIQKVGMAIVGMAMSFAPLAVFGLLAQSMILTGPQVLFGLGIYAGTVMGAMVLLYMMYVLIALILGRVSPMKFLTAAREPTLIGFSTNSSAATMPVTVRNAEEKLGIRPALTQFVIPLGATINMGGTACYQGLATLFMAQIFGLDLSIGMLTALTVTTIGASIGTPAVPGVGIVVLSGVLSSAGIPTAGLPLILGLDRILERFRTSLNVTGDLVACSVLERFIKKE